MYENTYYCYSSETIKDLRPTTSNTWNTWKYFDKNTCNFLNIYFKDFRLLGIGASTLTDQNDRKFKGQGQLKRNAGKEKTFQKFNWNKCFTSKYRIPVEFWLACWIAQYAIWSVRYYIRVLWLLKCKLLFFIQLNHIVHRQLVFRALFSF